VSVCIHVRKNVHTYIRNTQTHTSSHAIMIHLHVVTTGRFSAAKASSAGGIGGGIGANRHTCAAYDTMQICLYFRDCVADDIQANIHVYIYIYTYTYRHTFARAHTRNSFKQGH
jgi:hypothetical protein